MLGAHHRSMARVRGQHLDYDTVNWVIEDGVGLMSLQSLNGWKTTKGGDESGVDLAHKMLLKLMINPLYDAFRSSRGP